MPKINVSVKAHGGHDATWVTFEGETNTEVAELLDEFRQLGISALVGEAVTVLRAEEILGAQLGARPVTAPPAAASTAPQSGTPAAPETATPYGTPPACPHGTKKFLEKPYKNKPGTWKAWACPAPQGTPGACSLEFIR